MITLGGLRTSVYKEISLLEIAGIFQLLKSHVTSITELLPRQNSLTSDRGHHCFLLILDLLISITTKKNHLMVTRLGKQVNFVSLAMLTSSDITFR